MSDTGPTGDQPTGDAPSGDDGSKLRSQFESQKATDDAEIARLKTENAAIRALPGIDVTKPAVAAFISGYKGELTPEAIVKAAEDWDIKPGAAAPTDPTAGDPPDPKAPGTKATAPTPEERAATAAAAKAGGGAAAPTADVPDPYKAGTDAFNKALEDGKDREAAFESFLAPVIDAGAKGNEQVILPGGRVGGD